jgi:hypothetical protein
MLYDMAVLSIVPQIDADGERLHVCTSPFVRLLWLLSYRRCLTIERGSGAIRISTQHLWVRRRERIIHRDEVSHIVYRAQALPSLNLWRYVSLDGGAASDAALFLISLALKNHADEEPLFTVWQAQPDSTDWLDRLAGAGPDAPSTGDEAAGSLVELLHNYLGVPIAQH